MRMHTGPFEMWFRNLNSKPFEKRMTDINCSTFIGHIQRLCHPNSLAIHIEVLARATSFLVPVYFRTDPPLNKAQVVNVVGSVTTPLKL